MSEPVLILVTFTRQCSPFNAGETAGFPPAQARHLLNGDKVRHVPPAGVLAPSQDPAAARMAMSAVPAGPAEVAASRSRVAEAEAKKASKDAEKAEVAEAREVLLEAYEGLVKELVEGNTREELDERAEDVGIDHEACSNKTELAKELLAVQGHRPPE